MSPPSLCFISRVPGELLTKIFKYLLPALFDTGVLRYPITQGDASDLCQCRLVCRMFYDAASPFVWRRVKLVLPGYRTSSPATVSVANTHASRLSDITQFMAAHKTIMEWVRLITLSSHGSLYDVSFTRGVVADLSTFPPLLTNLRVLSLQGVSTLPCQFIVNFFLSPSLRAVRLVGIDCSSFSVDQSTVNTSIKQLGIHRCKSAERLYSIMPSLEAFDGEMDAAIAVLPLWNSLREASFQVDDPVWDQVARSFVTWRNVRRHIPLALTELMICQWHFNPKIKNLDPIIRSFAGNPLAKLILFYVEEPTASHLEQIVHVFPRLAELSLLSDEELARWPSDLLAYGNALGSLESLRLLEWNYYDADDRNVYGNWDMVSEERLTEIVLSLAKTCDSLRSVHFCLVIDGLMELSITRDDEGRVEALPPVYADSWTYCTSAWAARSFMDI
ncbi:hypothetical protein BU17DRAFT_101098 [Hysterangium stoloniferum]|nr:hypothetical protein BU17DRAFT_101098 [Hysterangium stoloniferum]